MGRANSQSLYKPRVQEWIYLLIGYRGDVGVADQAAREKLDAGVGALAQARVYVTTVWN